MNEMKNLGEWIEIVNYRLAIGDSIDSAMQYAEMELAEECDESLKCFDCL